MADQMEKALAYWQKNKAQLIALHPSKNALIADGELVEIFNDFVDAYKFGLSQFGEGNFLIKEIDASIQNLGYMSCHLSTNACELSA